MKKLFTFLAVSCCLNSLDAQDGMLDPTYGNNGLSVIKNPNKNFSSFRSSVKPYPQKNNNQG